MIDPLEQLGREVATQLGDGPSRERQEALRQTVGAMPLRRRRPRAVWVPGGLALAAAAGVLLFLSLPREGPSATSNRVVHHAEELAEGSWLSSATGGDELRFEDGSRLRLAEQTRVRLARADQEHVVLSLEDGRVGADIRRQGRRWTIEAGPFAVEVLGTAFDVTWSAPEERAEVRVTRGVVRVRGGTLGSRGVELRRGDHLDLDATERRAVLVGEEHANEASRETETRGETADRPTRQRTPRAEPSPAPSPTWQGLAEQRNYRGALDAAEQQGFDRLCRELGPVALDTLASVARYARNGVRARQALDALRGRFPQRPEGQMAVFLLGRVAAEIERNPTVAARWFREYVERHPQGSMAGEAQGRLIQAYSQSGNRRAARQAARSYLESHPEGPYAAAAQAVAEGGSIE